MLKHFNNVSGILSPTRVTRSMKHSRSFRKHSLGQKALGFCSKIDSFINDYTLNSPLSDDKLINISPGQRIVSFGDVHGDLSALQKFLRVAKVIDCKSTPENPIWIGGDTICVQCGDILDRGEEELACMRLLSSLSKQAHDAGGSLICLLGNHEIKNALGSFEYTLHDGNIEFDSVFGSHLNNSLGKDERWRIQFANNEPSRWAVCEPGLGILSQVFFANMKVAVVVGNTAFVHAGLTKSHIITYGGITGLNSAAKDWILKVHHNEVNNHGHYKSVEEVIASAQNRMKSAMSTLPHCIGGDIGSQSPVWMRDYSRPCDKDPTNLQAQSMIDDVLSEIGCKRLIMGHTPQIQINAALQGKAWRIDVGASKGVKNGTPEVLEIVHGDEEDSIHILTMKNERIPSFERHVLDILI